MTAPDPVLAAVTIAAQAASDKMGDQIVAFDVSGQLSITDIFLIASASNERQVGAIVDGVEEALIKKVRLKPTRREGDRENRWVLLDYVDFVVHVQHTEERSLYNLERLWKDCPQVPLDIERPEPTAADDVAADDVDFD